jgi:hypothetical protein
MAQSDPQTNSTLDVEEAARALREDEPVALVADLERQLRKQPTRRALRTVCTV